MAFSFIKNTPPLDEASILWMFDSFGWALKQFDAGVFFDETRLISPTNKFFPSTAKDPLAKASLIFEQTKTYAGLQHWSYRLVDESTVDGLGLGLGLPQIPINGALRGSKGIAVAEQSDHYVIPNNLALLKEPAMLIASYTHYLAHYLGTKSQEPPPGGSDNWPHVTELLAVFLGFGLIMANTAYTNNVRSCASCSGPSIERANFLSQYDMTYALAIFCCLKKIPKDEVLQKLNKTLRPFFKKAIKDINVRNTEIENLLQYQSGVV